jgi:hypothetical protein
VESVLECGCGVKRDVGGVDLSGDVGLVAEMREVGGEAIGDVDAGGRELAA